MKKTIICLLVCIPLLFSCNVDATQGIFQDVLTSQPVANETIKQYIGSIGNLAYVLTEKGIMTYDGANYTTIISTDDYPLITYATLSSAKDTIYFTNSSATGTTPEQVTVNTYKYVLASKAITTVTLPTNYRVSAMSYYGNYARNTADTNVNLYQFTDDPSGTMTQIFAGESKTSGNKLRDISMHFNRYATVSLHEPESDDDASFTNYIVKKTGNNPPEATSDFLKITNLSSNYKVISAIWFSDTDGGFIATIDATSSTSLKIRFHRVDATGVATEKTSLSSSSTRPFIMEEDGNGHVFFHIYGRSYMYYFNKASIVANNDVSYSYTSMTKLSSSMSFVAVDTTATLNPNPIIVTNKNGFYRLNDVTAKSGLTRCTTSWDN